MEDAYAVGRASPYAHAAAELGELGARVLQGGARQRAPLARARLPLDVDQAPVVVRRARSVDQVGALQVFDKA